MENAAAAAVQQASALAGTVCQRNNIRPRSMTMKLNFTKNKLKNYGMTAAPAIDKPTKYFYALLDARHINQENNHYD